MKHKQTNNKNQQTQTKYNTQKHINKTLKNLQNQITTNTTQK